MSREPCLARIVTLLPLLGVVLVAKFADSLASQVPDHHPLLRRLLAPSSGTHSCRLPPGWLLSQPCRIALTTEHSGILRPRRLSYDAIVRQPCKYFQGFHPRPA